MWFCDIYDSKIKNTQKLSTLKIYTFKSKYWSIAKARVGWGNNSDI